MDQMLTFSCHMREIVLHKMIEKGPKRILISKVLDQVTPKPYFCIRKVLVVEIAYP